MDRTKTMKVDINRFDGKSNFSLWQSRVKDVLIQMGLISALLYKKKPDPMEDEKWELMQMQTVSTIRLYLADEVVIHVLEETSPTAMWAKLEELYMAKSLTNSLFLWRQFYQLRMAEGQSVQEHLSNFQKILTDLLSVGEKVEEKTRALVLLSSLPPSFESLVTALLVGKSTIKMEEVTSALLQNEVLRRENRASSSGGGSALAVTGGCGGRRHGDRGPRRRRSKSRTRDDSKIKCYRCDQLGHRVRDCPQLKDRTIATAAAASSDSDTYISDALMVADEVPSSQEWILDSACTYHVCCREELFESLESSEGAAYMPDGSSCAIAGIGTVSMATHDGTVRKLGEVRYIPSFKQNLVSLSRLDSNGFRWEAGDGVLSVKRGDRVILKGKKRRGGRAHYYLVGSPVRGGAPRAGGSGTGRDTREDDKRRRRVKFLLPQDTSPSRSQSRQHTADDRGGSGRPGPTPILAHP